MKNLIAVICVAALFAGCKDKIETVAVSSSSSVDASSVTSGGDGGAGGTSVADGGAGGDGGSTASGGGMGGH